MIPLNLFLKCALSLENKQKMLFQVCFTRSNVIIFMSYFHHLNIQINVTLNIPITVYCQ